MNTSLAALLAHKSYAALGERAARIAELLARRGIRVLGIAADNSPDWISVDFAAQGPPMNGNREFHGRRRESLEEFWGKHDAADIAKELGKSGKCVQPDGTVHFKDRAEQRQYMTDKKAMLQRFKEKAERRKQHRAKKGLETAA